MKRIIMYLLIIFVYVSPVLAFDPMISTQGVLRDDTGAPVPDGTYNIRFKLYDQETGGSPIWSELHANVQMTNGMFSVDLGNSNSLSSLPFDQKYWLAVKVESNPELSPRTPLHSAVYALSLVGGDNELPSSGDVIVGDGDVVLGENSEIVFSDGSSFSSVNLGINHLDTPDGSTTDVVYVDNSSNVGIGTTTPNSKLHVNGNVTSNGYIYIENNGDLSVDTLKLAGLFGVEQGTSGGTSRPIVIKRYSGDIPNDQAEIEVYLPDSDHPPSEWTAMVAGFYTAESDWHENSDGNLFEVRLNPTSNGEQWVINAKIRAHVTLPHWVVDVMFINNKLVDDDR